MLKEVITIVFLLFPLYVNAVDYDSWGYPSSQNGENYGYLSLELGESWRMNSGKWLRGHLGIDIVMDAGNSIYVASDGTIEQVFNWPTCEGYVEVCIEERCTPKWMDNRGWGPTVVIKHEYQPYFESENTYLEVSPAQDEPIVVYTQYGHLDDVSHLQVGQEVKKGEKLANVGKICDWIPHIHFEIKDGDGLAYDIAHSDGDAGFGYSGTDGHAPHRYIPQAFIEANKHLELPHEEIEELAQPEYQPRERTSIFSRIKNFFASIFSRSSEGDVEGEVSNNQEQTQDPASETETEDPIETDAVPTYDAALLATAPISITSNEREVLVTIQARNTGNQAWIQSQVSLNVVGGRTANSEYRHSSWLTDLRPTRLDQSRVAPGDIGTFTALIRVPEGSSDFTFRAQLVRQSGSQFLQLGSGFASVDIQISADIATEPEVAGEQVSSAGTAVPSTGIGKQIRNVIDNVTREVGEQVSNAAEQLSNMSRRIFFGGGRGSSSSNTNTDEDAEVVPDAVDTPSIVIMSPTSSPYHATTSSIEITGTINDVVHSMSVSTTASGTFSFSTTSLTWQWIGELSAGTTTITIFGSSNEQTTSTDVIAYYAPTYELTPPTILSPTTSSVWYTSATTTLLRGIVDHRATQLRSASTSIDLVSSTWDYLVSTTVEGFSTYEFVASDNFENMSPITTFTLFYDTTVPAVTTSSFERSSTTISYSLVATDTLSGIAQYELQLRSVDAGDVGSCVDSTTTVPLADMDTTTTCQWGAVTTDTTNFTVAIPTLLGESDLVVRWRAIDRAGNASSWNTTRVTFEVVAEEIVPGPIVISQIAWMGTTASANDEWIELYNHTDELVDVYGWYLTWGDYDADSGTYAERIDILPPPEFPDEGLYLPPHAYVTFERTDEQTIRTQAAGLIYTGALRNDGELLQLWDANGTLIDQMDMRGGWAAGNNSTKESMVRIHPALAGSSAQNWCTFFSCDVMSLAGPAIHQDADDHPINGSPRMPEMSNPESPPEVSL